MKKYSVLLIIILISTFSYQQISAQDKVKTDKDKEIKMQQSIEQQKKAMSEQKKSLNDAEQKVLNDAEQNMNENPEIDRELKEAQEGYENANRERTKIFMNLPRGNRSFNFDEPFVLGGSDWEGFSGHMGMGDAERTTWDFSKTIKDNTFSENYSFDVQKTAKSVVMSVMGDCKSGDIRIKIVMPNGKNYSDILIDESGNLNWRKSFSITETENQDKAGDWKFLISSNKATGYFKISLQAY
jgi:hypothetical protein